MSNGWHVDKRVSIGHIVTTVMAVAVFVGWISTVDRKTDTNRQNIEFNRAMIVQTSDNVDKGFADIKDDHRAIWVELRRMNERLGDKADR